MLWVIVTNAEGDMRRAGTWIVRAESLEGAIDRFLSLGAEGVESMKMGIVDHVFSLIRYAPGGENLECSSTIQALNNYSFSMTNEKAKQDLLSKEKENIAEFLISLSDSYFLCNATTIL